MMTREVRHVIPTQAGLFKKAEIRVSEHLQEQKRCRLSRRTARNFRAYQKESQQRCYAMANAIYPQAFKRAH